jgi:hypothetical protein
VVSRSFKIGGERVAVRTTSAAFGDWLDLALGAYRLRRRLDPEYSVVVDGGDADGTGTGRRFHIVYQGTGTVTRSLYLPTAAGSLLQELETKLLGGRDDAIFIHAALVTRGERAALIPSWLASYLSSLGRRIPRAGVRLPLARWVAVDPATGHVVPRPPALEVPEDALALLARDARNAEAADERGEVRGPVRIDTIITYQREVYPLEPATKGTTVAQLTAATANLDRMGGGALEGIARLVEGAATFRLGALGRAQQGLDALLQALGEPNGDGGRP